MVFIACKNAQLVSFRAFTMFKVSVHSMMHKQCIYSLLLVSALLQGHQKNSPTPFAASLTDTLVWKSWPLRCMASYGGSRDQDEEF